PPQPEHAGLFAGGGTEVHTLHPAFHQELRGGGHAPAPCGSAEGWPGAGPPAASIASSSIGAVTGPRNSSTTRPSGPISHVIGRPRGVGKSAGGSSVSTIATGYVTGWRSRNSRIAPGSMSS